jgi:hypothetical protein
MVTFGTFVDLSDVKPAGKTRTPRDMSHLTPYTDALQALRELGPGKAGLADLDPSESAKTRNMIISAGKRLDPPAVVRVNFRTGPAGPKSQMVYWIDASASVPESNYDKLSREAKERGITVKALREERSQERAARRMENDVSDTNESMANDEPAREPVGARGRSR